MIMKILVIVPAYNEEDNLGDLVHNLRSLKEPSIDILVINDCSTDGTLRRCRELGVQVIDLPCNLGIGGAVQTGYKYAWKHGYDIAIQVDGDGQHKAEYIPALIEPILQNEADFVIGSRYIVKQGFQSSAVRRAGIRYFSLLIGLVTGQAVTDPTSGFRACNSKILKKFNEYYPKDYPEPETIVLLKRHRYRISEVPVMMQERLNGVSSISPLKSAYYLTKVSLAIIIDVFRRKTVNGGS